MSINSKQELLDCMQREIKERLQWEIDHGNIEGMTWDDVSAMLQDDMRHEIIDNNIPIYYNDLANLLQEDHDFAYVEDEALLPANPDVWKIIATSVYEFLTHEYYDLSNEVIDELLPDLED